MRDETAWQVQERMIEAYFRARDGSGSAIGELSEGAMLVRMAMAYHEQEKRIKAIEAHQQHEQALMIQAQKDMIALQAQHLALQEHVIEAKDMALTAIQSMQWVTIRQYVEIYRMQRQMPPLCSGDMLRGLPPVVWNAARPCIRLRLPTKNGHMKKRTASPLFKTHFRVGSGVILAQNKNTCSDAAHLWRYPCVTLRCLPCSSCSPAVLGRSPAVPPKPAR